MKNQTIYSYTLLYRFRWGVPGYLVQLLLLAGTLVAVSFPLDLSLHQLLPGLAVLVLLPVSQFLLFRLFAYAASLKTSLTPDTLFSPWWGAGTTLPLSLGHFRSAELTVIAGTLCISLGLYVWLPLIYGVSLLAGLLAALLPRVLVLVLSMRQPAYSRVKYELRSVAFLRTDG